MGGIIESGNIASSPAPPPAYFLMILEYCKLSIINYIRFLLILNCMINLFIILFGVGEKRNKAKLTTLCLES